jgi:hypothetical protein
LRITYNAATTLKSSIDQYHDVYKSLHRCNCTHRIVRTFTTRHKLVRFTQWWVAVTRVWWTVHINKWQRNSSSLWETPVKETSLTNQSLWAWVYSIVRDPLKILKLLLACMVQKLMPMSSRAAEQSASLTFQLP